MKWTYSFFVWPHEKGHCREIYTLFESINTRIEMEFTEEEFGLFRAAIEREGLTLREIERVPYHKPESVI